MFARIPLTRFSFALAILIAWLFLSGFSPNLESVSLENCHDGDTCRTVSGERIRFACIDAPELKQEFGTASRDYLRSLLKGKEVKIHRLSSDRFSRTIALLYVKNGKEWQALQLLQIKTGTVWANEKYKSDCPIWPAIDREFQKAQHTRTGLFKKSNPIPPWQWRGQNR